MGLEPIGEWKAPTPNHPKPFCHDPDQLVLVRYFTWQEDEFSHYIIEDTFKPTTNAFEAPSMPEREWYLSRLYIGPYDSAQTALLNAENMVRIWRQTVNTKLKELVQQ